jgi:uncharacterized protein (TIGR02147 family)
LKKKIFENLPEELTVSKFLDYKNYLRSIFLHIKKSDPKYKLETFSKSLGFSSTNIASQYVNGTRKLSVKAAKTIATSLGLKGDHRKYFLTLVEYNNSTDVKESEKYFDSLYTLKGKINNKGDVADQMAYYSNWYIPIIGEMARLDGFSSTPEWISSKLGGVISISQIEESLMVLERLNILERTPVTGEFVRTEKSFSTDQEVRGFVVKSFHKQMLDQSSSALLKVKAKSRNINSLTLCCSAKEYDEIIKKIQILMNESLKIEKSANDKTNIYQLNLQLFPLTDRDLKEVKK